MSLRCRILQDGFAEFLPLLVFFPRNIRRTGLVCTAGRLLRSSGPRRRGCMSPIPVRRRKKSCTLSSRPWPACPAASRWFFHNSATPPRDTIRLCLSWRFFLFTVQLLHDFGKRIAAFHHVSRPFAGQRKQENAAQKYVLHHAKWLSCYYFRQSRAEEWPHDFGVFLFIC